MQTFTAASNDLNIRHVEMEIVCATLTLNYSEYSAYVTALQNYRKDSNYV